MDKDTKNALIFWGALAVAPILAILARILK